MSAMYGSPKGAGLLFIWRRAQMACSCSVNSTKPRPRERGSPSVGSILSGSLSILACFTCGLALDACSFTCYNKLHVCCLCNIRSSSRFHCLAFLATPAPCDPFAAGTHCIVHVIRPANMPPNVLPYNGKLSYTSLESITAVVLRLMESLAMTCTGGGLPQR